MEGRSVRHGSILLLGAVVVLLLGAAPVAAHHKDGHEGGPKDKGSSGSTVTEDNDDNDGGTPNNEPDDGDNKHPSGKDRSVEPGNSGNQGKSPSDPDGDSNGGPDKPGGSGGDDLADQDGNNGCGNDDDFEDDNNGNCGGPEHEARESKSVCTGDMSKGREKKCDAPAPAEDASCPDGETMGSDEGGCGSPEADDDVCVDDSTMPVGTTCDDAVADTPTTPDESGPLTGGLETGADVLGETISRDIGGGGSDAPAFALGDQAFAAGPAQRPATMPLTGADVMTFLAAGLGLFVTGLGIVRFRGD
ncbi:MAG: hypothetical protein ACRDLB_11725 [Actinomycetota bacterium]